MSWHIKVAALGADLETAVAAQLAYSKKYAGSEPQHPTIDAITAAAGAFGASFPARLVMVESSGHIDALHGNVKLELQLVGLAPGTTVVGPPEAAAAPAVA